MKLNEVAMMKDFARCLLLTIILRMSIAQRQKVIKYPLGSHTPRPRVVKGLSDEKNEYPFVVTILAQMPKTPQSAYKYEYARLCTGSLITNRFVLTAGHCVSKDVQPLVKLVRCGDMSLPQNETKCVSNVMKLINHPLFMQYKYDVNGGNRFNDIGLIQIQELTMDSYGKLHSADYKSVLGRPVRYAGFGAVVYHKHVYTKDVPEMIELQSKPLQIGEGVIFTDDEKLNIHPRILVGSKCSKRDQVPFPGDSGGPVFLEGKIVGVVSGFIDKHPFVQNIPHHPAFFAACPISPYLNWINQVVVAGGT